MGNGHLLVPLVVSEGAEEQEGASRSGCGTSGKVAGVWRSLYRSSWAGYCLHCLPHPYLVNSETMQILERPQNCTERIHREEYRESAH